MGTNGNGRGRDGDEAILIVDDDAGCRRLLSLTLSLAGFRSVEAASADEALAALHRESVAAVLLDKNMPGMGGIELVRVLRAGAETATLPVIMVTGDADIAERVGGLDAGASDYIVKPFEPDELVARVRAKLREAAVWSAVVDAQLQEREAIVEALVRMDRSDPEQVAKTVCSELGRLPGVESVALVVFAGSDLALPLGVQGMDAWAMDVDRPLPPSVARELRERAATGPFVRDAEDTGAAGCLAVAPIHDRGQVAGVLLVGPSERTGRPPALSAARALSAAIDVAAVTAMALAPALDRTLWRERRTALENVIASRAFTPVFQPIVELDRGEVVGYEALIRFSDGTGPAVRFAEAATLGLGLELERAALRATIHQSHTVPEGCWVSVNASPTLVLEQASLRSAMDASSRSLVAELTEHDPVADYSELRAAFDDLGPRLEVSIDDAGSGFATLRHVLALHPSFMKLDRSWVAGVDDDPARQALIAGLGHFATKTGCRLIAEGVETEQELDSLRALDVELGQGYLLGAPAELSLPG